MGHGFLREPASRNFVANREMREFCPHCLQSGGPTTVKERAGGHWPSVDRPESHGLCGNPVQGGAVEANWRDDTYLVPSAVQSSYKPGAVVEFSVEVRAHHRGHFEFRICDQALDGQTLASRADGQACLDKWILERAAPNSACTPGDSDPDCAPVDRKHPGRWYVPPPQGGTEVYKMRYKIPAGLQCSHCTLQWYWSTGNTCVYDADYNDYSQQLQDGGWQASQWFAVNSGVCGSAYAEEFWNCADIAVGEGAPAPNPPTLAPSTPMPSVTPAPPVPMPVPQPQPAPSPVPTNECAGQWSQCGGTSWTGPTCCVAGNVCNLISQWYHQCQPGGSASPGPSPTTTVTPMPSGDGCAPLWGKCGGQGWDGPVCCEEGARCNEQDQWYSQCVLGPALLQATKDTPRGRRAFLHHTLSMVEIARALTRVNATDEDDIPTSKSDQHTDERVEL